MSTTRIFLVTLIMGCAGYAREGRAHALEADPAAGGVGVVARYADGTPAAFVPVQVFAPGQDAVFQDGATDRHGVFLFAPDTGGVWRLQLDDGMGHVLDHTLTVSDEHTLRVVSRPGRGSRWCGGVAGVGLIFGAFGLYSLFRRRSKA
jgi:hypothetical protein